MKNLITNTLVSLAFTFLVISWFFWPYLIPGFMNKVAMAQVPPPQMIQAALGLLGIILTYQLIKDK